MRKLASVAVAIALLVTLSGCGPYALAFTPTAGLPEADAFAGTWEHRPENAFLGESDSTSGATITLSADGTFTVAGVASDALGTEDGEWIASSSVVEASGTWSLPEGRPDSLDHLVLSGLADHPVNLYFHHQPLSEPIFFFSPGLVDDGHWYRFTRLGS